MMYILFLYLTCTFNCNEKKKPNEIEQYVRIKK